MAPVPALRVFGIEPDPLQDILVRRQYTTSILTGESGAEQRVSLSDMPLVTLAFTVQQVEAKRWGESLGAATPTAQGRMLVPFWPDAVELSGPLEAGQVLVPAVTDTRDFTVGGWVLLWSPNVNGTVRWEAAEVLAVAADSLTLADPAVQSWREGSACVVPLVVGVLSASVSANLDGTQAGTIPVEFVLEPPVEGRGLTAVAAPAAVVASVVVETMMSGQNTSFFGTPLSMSHEMPHEHWYFRAVAFDAIGAVIPRTVFTWTSNVAGATIIQSGDPGIIRHVHGTIPSGFDVTVTATAGGVTGSVTAER